MHQVQARTIQLSGTSYEIGYQLGVATREIPPLKQTHTAGMEGFGPEQVLDAIAMFDRWCPGLSDELRGFADALQVPAHQVVYYAMTYLIPRCSHIAVPAGRTADGRPLLARNYEFNHEMEDFCFLRTSVAGKYTHIGTSVLHFGREDGLNEHGLAVTMSSCGFPVGAVPYMREPKLNGLMYWAVLRAVLENCKDVQEAVDYIADMPIAYNINMILMDKAGQIALVETLDAKRAVKRNGLVA